MSQSFIYFDLGNVLLHFDHQRACDALAELGDGDPDRVRQALFTSGLQTRYELGECTDQEFCDALRTRLNLSASDATILQICSDIFDLNINMLPVLCQLNRSGHRLGILSNTCRAHWQWVASGRYEVLPKYFQRRVLSYEVGAMKPDPRIYAHAIAQAGTTASDIFFMDDRPENAEAARRAGIHAVVFQDVRSLIRDLAAFTARPRPSV